MRATGVVVVRPRPGSRSRLPMPSPPTVDVLPVQHEPVLDAAYAAGYEWAVFDDVDANGVPLPLPARRERRADRHPPTAPDQRMAGFRLASVRTRPGRSGEPVPTAS